MKLFVFEGKYPEETIFDSLRTLFPSSPKDEVILCTYGCIIYSLYSRMKKYYEDDGDVVKVLKELYVGKKDAPITEDMEGNSFSEIFLFFDYDLHHENDMSIEEKDKAIKEMLAYFNDETDKGKLYISFPMAESLFYTKELEDMRFPTYQVSIMDSCHFKEMASVFNYYCNILFLCLNDRHKNSNYDLLKKNWLLMVRQTIKKVNYIVNGCSDYPANKMEIKQVELFSSILDKYVLNGSIPVLSAFPIFLYDNEKSIGH